MRQTHSRWKVLLYCAVAFNAGLVIVTFILSASATQKYPQHGRLIPINGAALHVIDSGQPQDADNASTIVLLHGASTSARDFTHNLQTTLAANYRVLSIDRPGHGYSERGHHENVQSAQPTSQWMDPSRQARTILEALHQLGIRKPILVGHSWAGSVVLAALLQTGSDVQAGVLIAGVSHPWNGKSARHVKLAATPIIGPVFTWQYITPIGRMLMAEKIADVFSPDSVPQNYVEQTGLHLSLRPQTFLGNAEDLHHLNDYLVLQAKQYSQIEKPLLSIVGTADHVVPAANHHDKLTGQVPHLNTLELDNAGHAPHHSRQISVHDAIVTFVKQL